MGLTHAVCCVLGAYLRPFPGSPSLMTKHKWVWNFALQVLCGVRHCPSLGLPLPSTSTLSGEMFTFIRQISVWAHSCLCQDEGEDAESLETPVSAESTAAL